MLLILLGFWVRLFVINILVSAFWLGCEFYNWVFMGPRILTLGVGRRGGLIWGVCMVWESGVWGCTEVVMIGGRGQCLCGV